MSDRPTNAPLDGVSVHIFVAGTSVARVTRNTGKLTYLGDIRLDESGFGLRQCIRDAHM